MKLWLLSLLVVFALAGCQQQEDADTSTPFDEQSMQMEGSDELEGDEDDAEEGAQDCETDEDGNVLDIESNAGCKLEE